MIFRITRVSTDALLHSYIEDLPEDGCDCCIVLAMRRTVVSSRPRISQRRRDGTSTEQLIITPWLLVTLEERASIMPRCQLFHALRSIVFFIHIVRV
jgi:hypothetical protein